VSDPTAVR